MDFDHGREPLSIHAIGNNHGPFPQGYAGQQRRFDRRCAGTRENNCRILVLLPRNERLEQFLANIIESTPNIPIPDGKYPVEATPVARDQTHSPDRGLIRSSIQFLYGKYFLTNRFDICLRHALLKPLRHLRRSKRDAISLFQLLIHFY